MSRPKRRKALLIGTETYDDGRFAPLPSVRADLWQLQQVLQHRGIGAFPAVRPVADLTADDMRHEIAEFLDGCDEDEFALLYVSGHGTRLVQSGGEFHFIAKDTDFDRIAETAVGAGFVNELLEVCVAPQKVVMIDCCRSGGFAVGLRTTDGQRPGTAKSGEEPLLSSRGVYVLSSSRAGQDSYAPVPAGDEVTPSVFTGQIVEALRTGRAGKDGSGEVSVVDLFHYVNRRMRGDGSDQIPVASSLGVDDRIIIANCPQGPAPQLVPLSRGPLTETATWSPGTGAGYSKAAAQPTWSSLLAYYRDCVMADGSVPEAMSVSDHGKAYVCLSGSERLLAGVLDDDHGISTPPDAEKFVRQAIEQESELWAGYPAVVTHGTRNGGAASDFAPLLVRAVEPVHVDGEIRLRPYGPVIPHPGLAAERLGEDDAAALAESYQPTWHAGQHDRMAVDIVHLLRDEYALPAVQKIEPDRLCDRIEVDTPVSGARNSAVLYAVARNPGATAKLLKDLEHIERHAGQIKVTALAALSPEPAERALPAPDHRPQDVRLVTPLPANESQAEILRSAMSHRLTVATGPPGTGKSQLVANLVATAEAAGEKVLVASTNNQAVDEVCGRCERLSPGSVVRTGSRGYREAEAAALDYLRTVEPPASNPQTAQARLDVAGDRLRAARLELDRVASAERALREAGEARDVRAAELEATVAELLGLLRDHDGPESVARRAERAADAKLLGEWRRKRLLRRLGLRVNSSGTAATCRALARFGHADAAWQSVLPQAVGGPDDGALATRLATAQREVEETAAALLEITVRSSARHHRHLITELIRAQNGDGSDWRAVKNALTAVRGWAVTSLSARRFPPEPALFDLVIIDEASQCAIPHILPLLFRARRALVIGDVMQLPHVSRLNAEREAVLRREHGLRPEWLEKYRLGFRRYSAFHAAERSLGSGLLLDEHFRCHPQIAAFVNERFYDGNLNVLTDIRGRPALPARPAILWSDVQGQARKSGTSWINPVEIEKVLESVRYLLEKLPGDATVGVVTPFKAQAEVVQRRWGAVDGRVRVGTVHTFQGGERDVMIFSLVAGEGMRPGTIRWIQRQLNLWNVAITRARSHLIVVGDAALWEGRRGLAADLRAAASGEFTAEGGQGLGDLQARLFRFLSNQSPGSEVDLGVIVNGHPADAMVRTADEEIPVILDPGPPAGVDAARHLRLILRRRDLLSPAEGITARRLPAWKLYEV
ncbi:Caspase domain-containing protein [Actinomadura glauciflava]|uniref:caspase, EACC1-associated type n=1 Tax=Actinomadura luteofluorescens TaxID=46163 RepID=UPI0021640E7B|nr:AAA domain-containing protein [Actinomadura glauciflava]MCR3740351.1 Caspase domain-containing protein [Actinomadura glauciflava]